MPQQQTSNQLTPIDDDMKIESMGSVSGAGPITQILHKPLSNMRGSKRDTSGRDIHLDNEKEDKPIGSILKGARPASSAQLRHQALEDATRTPKPKARSKRDSKKPTPVRTGTSSRKFDDSDSDDAKVVVVSSGRATTSATSHGNGKKAELAKSRPRAYPSAASAAFTKQPKWIHPAEKRAPMSSSLPSRSPAIASTSARPRQQRPRATPSVKAEVKAADVLIPAAASSSSCSYPASARPRPSATASGPVRAKKARPPKIEESNSEDEDCSQALDQNMTQVWYKNAGYGNVDSEPSPGRLARDNNDDDDDDDGEVQYDAFGDVITGMSTLSPPHHVTCV